MSRLAALLSVCAISPDVSNISPFFTKVSQELQELHKNVPNTYTVVFNTTKRTIALALLLIPNDGRFPTLSLDDVIFVTGKIYYASSPQQHRFIIQALEVEITEADSSRSMPFISLTGLCRPVFVSELENRYELILVNTSMRYGTPEILKTLYV